MAIAVRQAHATERVGGILRAIVARTSDLLGAQVWALDADDFVLATTEPDAVGLPLTPRDEQHLACCVRVPLPLSGYGAATLAIHVPEEETISPNVAAALVGLISAQAEAEAERPSKAEMKRQLMQSLVLGTVTDEATLLRQGQVLGIDFTLPRAVLLINASEYILRPSGDDAAGTYRENRGTAGPASATRAFDELRAVEAAEAQAQRRAANVIAGVVSFFHLPSDNICAYIGGGEVAVFKASTTGDLIAWRMGSDEGSDHWSDEAVVSAPSWSNLALLKRAGEALLSRLRCDTGMDISIGLGRYHPGVRGLTRSYEDARAALTLGRHFRGRNQVHCLDALGVAAFVGISDERTQGDLARHLLSPLDHESELISTLEVYFRSDCCPSTTAKALLIHRNTLSYRLDKVVSLTGLDPRRFDDAVQIRLALLVRSLRSA